jgi:hypothetical protein
MNYGLNFIVLHGDLRERYTNDFYQNNRMYNMISLSPSNNCVNCIQGGYPNYLISLPYIIIDSFIYVGRNSTEKGIDYLKILSNHLKILMIGIDIIINDEQVIQKYICGSKGIIIPSVFEGGPIVAIYASLCEVPVFMFETGVSSSINANILSGDLPTDLQIINNGHKSIPYRSNFNLQSFLKPLFTRGELALTGGYILENKIICWKDCWIYLSTQLIIDGFIEIATSCKKIKLSYCWFDICSNWKSVKISRRLHLFDRVILKCSNCVINNIHILSN